MANKKISAYPQAGSVNNNQEFVINNDGITNKINWGQLKGNITTYPPQSGIESGAGAPTSIPDFIGQTYIDTTNDWSYIAVGTASSADWQKTALYAFGTVTVTAGGGDVTVNLPFNWTDGLLILHRAESSTDYFETDAGGKFLYYETSYEALTNATYTDGEIIGLRRRDAGVPEILEQTQAANKTGLPKSATTTSFTMDDDGVDTRYMKWVIIA